MRDVRNVVVVVAALSWVSSASGKDAPHPLVAVDIESCDGLSVDEVRRIVAAELGASLTAQRDPSSTTVATVGCPASGIELQVDDPVTGKKLRRTLDLRATDARATSRLVALAVVELVTASWTELEVTPNPIVAPAGPRPPEAAIAAARGAAVARLSREFRTPPQSSDDHDLAEVHPLRMAAVASVRSFSQYPGTLWGGGASIGEDRFTWLGWKADVLFETGQIQAFHGDITLSTATVSGAILAHVGGRVFKARAGLGFRVGAAQASGQALESAGVGTHTVLAPWGWPSLTGGISLTLKRLVIEVGVESGYAVIPISPSATGFNDVVVRGVWYGGQLGLGLSLLKVSRFRACPPLPR